MDLLRQGVKAAALPSAATLPAGAALAATNGKSPQVRAPPPPEYGCCEQTDVEQRHGDWRCDSCTKKVHYDCEPISKSPGTSLNTCSKCYDAIHSSQGRGRSKRPCP
jgi:hypothetical protein